MAANLRSRFRASLMLVALMLALVTVSQVPADAATKSTCNGAVCEQVTHYGTYVSQWRATVYPGSGYNCRTARFWVNGGLIDQTTACGTGTLSAYADTPYTLPSGSRLCASYVGEPGYACVTI